MVYYARKHGYGKMAAVPMSDTFPIRKCREHGAIRTHHVSGCFSLFSDFLDIGYDWDIVGYGWDMVGY